MNKGDSRVMRKPKPRATAVDSYVGTRVRLRRTLLGLSQTELGDVLGVTFQQIQKYENGSNRIGASRLYAVSEALEVPVSYFFEDIPEGLEKLPPHSKPRLVDEDSDDIMLKRETLELVRPYYQIESGNIRTSIRKLLKAMAAESWKS